MLIFSAAIFAFNILIFVSLGVPTQNKPSWSKASPGNQASTGILSSQTHWVVQFRIELRLGCAVEPKASPGSYRYVSCCTWSPPWSGICGQQDAEHIVVEPDIGHLLDLLKRWRRMHQLLFCWCSQLHRTEKVDCAQIHRSQWWAARNCRRWRKCITLTQEEFRLS